MVSKLEATQIVSVRLTESTVRVLDIQAQEWGLSRTKVIEMAVRRFARDKGISGIVDARSDSAPVVTETK